MLFFGKPAGVSFHAIMLRRKGLFLYLVVECVGKLSLPEWIDGFRVWEEVLHTGNVDWLYFFLKWLYAQIRNHELVVVAEDLESLVF